MRPQTCCWCSCLAALPALMGGAARPRPRSPSGESVSPRAEGGGSSWVRRPGARGWGAGLAEIRQLPGRPVSQNLFPTRRQVFRCIFVVSFTHAKNTCISP